MKAKSNALPLSRVSVEDRGDMAVVSLWDGTYTEAEKEGTVEGETEKEYEYEVYLMEVRNREGLAEAVEQSFEAWYEAAKAAEGAAEREREAAQAAAEFAGTLPETVLDLDFRLMMLEELGPGGLG